MSSTPRIISRRSASIPSSLAFSRRRLSMTTSSADLYSPLPTFSLISSSNSSVNVMVIVPPLFKITLALRAAFALAQAREHLGGDEEGLEERAGGEASGERAEEARGAGRVVEPPEVVYARE